MPKGMEQVNKYGKMVLNMKENGNKIKHVVKANFTIQMEIYMKVNGMIIKRMVMEYIYIKMGQNMKDSGKMTYKMDMGQKFGMMVAYMKGFIRMEKSIYKEYIHGLMDPIIQVSGQIIKFQDLVYINGLMGDNLRLIFFLFFFNCIHKKYIYIQG